ncbi:MAG: hypothetical protein ABIP11_08455 [Luteimonas sp.]
MRIHVAALPDLICLLLRGPLLLRTLQGHLLIALRDMRLFGVLLFSLSLHRCALLGSALLCSLRLHRFALVGSTLLRLHVDCATLPCLLLGGTLLCSLSLRRLALLGSTLLPLHFHFTALACLLLGGTLLCSLRLHRLALLRLLFHGATLAFLLLGGTLLCSLCLHRFALLGRMLLRLHFHFATLACLLLGRTLLGHRLSTHARFARRRLLLSRLVRGGPLLGCLVGILWLFLVCVNARAAGVLRIRMGSESESKNGGDRNGKEILMGDGAGHGEPLVG